jgi:hypothetical protein
VIFAVAAAAALAAPSRDALIQRWLHANRAHSITSLRSPVRNAAAPADLGMLAQSELSTPGRYRLSAPPAAPERESLWVRFGRWLGERWDRMWSVLSKRVHISTRAANGVGWALLAIVGFLLLWVAVRLLVNLQLSRASRRTAAVPLAVKPDPLLLYQQASDAAGRGLYGRAALLLFAATVALLDSRGAVSGNRSATVGDLRGQLRRSDASLVGPFDAVAGPFVETAYAERPIDDAQWQHARQAFVKLSEAP